MASAINDKCDVYSEMRAEWNELYNRDCVKGLFSKPGNEVTLLDVINAVALDEQSLVIRSLKYRCSKWRKVVEKSGADIIEARDELEDFRCKAKQAEDKYFTVCQEKVKLSSKVDILEGEMKSLQLKVDHSRRDLESSEVMKNVLQTKIKNLEEELKDLKDKSLTYKDMEEALAKGSSFKRPTEEDVPRPTKRPAFLYRKHPYGLAETHELFVEDSQVIDLGDGPAESEDIDVSEMEETEVP